MIIHSLPRPTFGSLADIQPLKGPLQAGKLVKAMDLHSLADTPRKQSRFIYTFIILSRLAAAAVRGHDIGNYREVFEHATRDSVGWAMFFFGASTLLRLFARVFAPKSWDRLMTKPTEAWVNKGFLGKTVAGKTDFLSRMVRGARRWGHALLKSDLLADTQIDAIKLKRLAEYRQAGTLSRQTLAALDKEFHAMKSLRNGLGTLSWIINIALMGVGIPLLNILITKQQVAEQKQAQQQRDYMPQIHHGLSPKVTPYGSDVASVKSTA